MESLLGKILSNRYRVDSLLGRGGMAEVYKVWDIERAAFLAFKLLREDLAQDPVFLRRFKREAQTLSRLQHPNIVRFYGLEQDDLLAFILMDFVEGTTLQTEIARAHGQGLSIGRVLEVMRPVCSALQFAHRQGVIHCDVKPGNILIEKTGRVLVTDFGIARISEAATTTTVAGAGTPAYMSPEQVRGENPTPQIDIYALGIILYEMLTGGERPFTGEQAQITGSTGDKVRWEHLNLAPPSPRRYNPEIPTALENVILKCLEKDPDKRYTSAMDLLYALERAMAEGEQPTVVEHLPSETLTMPAVHPAALEVDQVKGRQTLQPEMVTPDLPPDQQPRRRSHSGRWVAGLVGIGILVVLGLIGISWLGGILPGGEDRLAAVSTSTAPIATSNTILPTHTFASSSVPPTITYTPSPRPPTATPIPTKTPMPGTVVLPVDKLGRTLPWFPIDNTARPGVNYVAFNLAIPPFDKALVRQAFAYAIDRQVITEMAQKYKISNSKPATSLTPPETLGRDLYNQVGAAFNPKKAKELLAQAGYSDPSTFPAVTMIVSAPAGLAPGIRFNMAHAMVEMWQNNLGVSVQVKVISTFKDYTKRLETNPPEIFWQAWVADINDPDNFLREIFHSGSQYNYGHFSSSKFDQLVDDAAISGDPAKRQELYILAERLLCEEEAALIPLYHMTNP
jgi:hypothetical protein